jgi:hypothetical protein
VFKRNKKILIKWTSFAGIAGCLVDLISMFILGREIKGYSPLSNTMSMMGTSNSPVDHQIALWWILMGILFIIFGLGIRYAFSDKKKLAIIASWLIILYGVGEGLGSALFPEDIPGTSHTFTGLLHNFMGGLGTTSITIFTLVMAKLIPEYKKFSYVVFIVGMTGIIFFGIGQFWHNPTNFFVMNKGLWQRIFVMDYYLYVIVIAIKLITNTDNVSIEKYS